MNAQHSSLHSLLKRQLKRHFGANFEIPKAWRSFFEDLNAAYHEADTDREMLERALELSSQELLQANTEMRRRNTQLQTAAEVSKSASTILDPEILMNHTVNLIKARFNFHYVGIFLVDDRQQYAVLRSGTGEAGREMLRAGHRLAIGGGSMIGWCVAHAEARIALDVGAEAIRFDNPLLPLTRSEMALPLISRQRVVGALTVQSMQEAAFSKEDIIVLMTMADQLAIAIENAQLYAQEHQRAAVLAQALEQQRELDRLKNEFIQNVSHELRTPLAIVRGYAELLYGGELGELQSEQLQSVEIIARRTRMLSKLMDDLTAILEVEAQGIKFEPVDLAAIAMSILADFKAAAQKAKVTLEADIAPNLPLIAGDPTHLHRVLDNLMSNALKFTPAGGRITLQLLQENSQLVLKVGDTGVGIPTDKLEHIFKRFYQVDGSMTRRYGGVGLGLALVKEIIESHGGGVAVASTVNEGSTFTISLPIPN